MTSRGCGRACTPGETTGSLNGISYPTTMECCQTDLCNSAKILSISPYFFGSIWLWLSFYLSR